ncbi:MAG: TM2 domain-containing protein [Pseudomonadota bacterium]|nr:TM2 domain-containing protein [Pseudomonadota bacterium]
MAEMVYCRGCGKELHPSAPICPNCGAPQPIKMYGYKNRFIAAALAFLVGGMGIHRFYLGQWRGLWYLLFCWTGIPSFIAFIEGIVFLMTNQYSWDHRYNNDISSHPGGLTVALLILAALLGLTAFISLISHVLLPTIHEYVYTGVQTHI